MIPQTDISWQTASWQELLASSVRDPQELLTLLELRPELIDLDPTAEGFPLWVPLPYLARIEKGNANDPLLLQVLPQPRERLAVPGYSSDPVGESQSNVAPGLIHKYHGRVLMVVSTHCAINCRYCFRREFPYGENRLDRAAWQRAIGYIAADNTISEVIFSGGDPLAVSDRQLSWLVEQLSRIDHLKRLRIHTRLPVVIPSRITAQCLDWLTGNRLQPVVVVHCNHVNELDESVADAFAELRKAGVTLLNQSVLLRGVNDNVRDLEQLCQRLFAMGALPYYLHVLDKVKGAAHFDVPRQEALALMQQLRARLPGYLVPRLVEEVAGAPSKTILV